jgi:MFS family permease
MLLAPASAPSLSVLAISLAPIIVLGGFIGWLLDTGSTIQQPHENIRKTRRGSWSRLVKRLRVGILIGLIFGLAAGLSTGLSFWLLLGLFQGVSRETIEDQYRIIPNQGIRHSARNSLILGLISTGIAGLATGLAYGLAYGLIDGLSTGLSYGLSVGLIIGLNAGLLAGLLYGGLACLRHGVIRHLLWRAGSIPRNYPRFLDDAAERILLRKVGGGYIFVHRLLLEYFASLDGAPTLDVARAKKEQESPAS